MTHLIRSQMNKKQTRIPVQTISVNVSEEQTHKYLNTSNLNEQHEMQQLVYITEVIWLNKYCTGSGSPQSVTTNLHLHLNQNLPSLQLAPIDLNRPNKY